jgi:hypothetical protein
VLVLFAPEHGKCKINQQELWVLTASVSSARAWFVLKYRRSQMTHVSERVSPRDDIVAIAERASLYAILLSALAHQIRPPAVPTRLYDDLNAWPSQRPDFAPRAR